MTQVIHHTHFAIAVTPDEVPDASDTSGRAHNNASRATPLHSQAHPVFVEDVGRNLTEHSLKYHFFGPIVLRCLIRGGRTWYMTGDVDDAGDRVLGRLARGGVRYQTMTLFSTQRFSRVPGHQSGCPTPRGGFWGGLATFSAFLGGFFFFFHVAPVGHFAALSQPRGGSRTAGRGVAPVDASRSSCALSSCQVGLL